MPSIQKRSMFSGKREMNMNQYGKVKVAVIGTGHIGRYMRVCYEPMTGGNLKERAILIKATTNRVEEIRKEFGCPVVVGDGLEVLITFQPDVILVCPPPSQIPPIIENTLVPLARERRKIGLPKPDIYSFGPRPSVDCFYAALGDNANIVKILPNMFYEIKGKKAAFLEANYITFSETHPWPADAKARLDSFLEPLVNTYVVSEKDSVPFLGVRNAAHGLYDMCFLISDAMNARGIPGEHHQLAASVMRAELRHHWKDMPPQLVPCALTDLPSPISEFAARSVMEWILGLGDFCMEDHLPSEMADIVRRLRAEAYLASICVYNREELNSQTRAHATKGGVCEMSGIFFKQYCQEQMMDAFNNHLDGLLSSDWWAKWRKLGRDAAYTVARHGMRLSN